MTDEPTTPAAADDGDAPVDPVTSGDAPAVAFEPGELVLLIDHKKRQYLITLEVGGEFRSRRQDPHARSADRTGHGERVRVDTGSALPGVPADPRGLHPHDAKAGDLSEGHRPDADARRHRPRHEGAGDRPRLAGALSMALLPAEPEIHGYEHKARTSPPAAKKNVAAFLGEEALERYHVNIGDAYEGVDAVDMDVILDIPEPWNVVPHARGAPLGGIPWPTRPRSPRCSSCGRRSRRPASRRSRRSRCCTVVGTSRTRRLARITDMVAHTAFLTKARLALHLSRPSRIRDPHRVVERHDDRLEILRTRLVVADLRERLGSRASGVVEGQVVVVRTRRSSPGTSGHERPPRHPRG